MLTDYKKDALSILFISTLIILFFFQVLFGNSTFVYRDFSRYFYPLYLFNTSTLKDFILPLWNPYLYCGFPHLGLIQSALFYPPSCLLYLLPFNLGLKSFLVFHYLLAGITTYLLLRQWKLAPYPAIASALTFSLSGYLISTVSLINTLCSVAWTPLIFYFYWQAINQRRINKAILSGLIMALSLLGGDPVVFYLNVLALFLFTFSFGWAGLFGHLCRFMLMLLTSIGLTLFQLIPFLELTMFSIRATGLSYEEATKWSLKPFEMVNLIFPFSSWARGIEYSPFFESLHFGIIAIVLILVAILYLRQRLIIFWGLIFLVSIVLSLGSLLPGYKLLHQYLPFFKLCRYPVKFFSLVTFSAAVLTGFGFNYLLDNLKLKRWRFFGLAAAVTLACLSYWFFYLSDNSHLIDIVCKPYFSHIYSPAVILLSLLAVLISLFIWARTNIPLSTFSLLIIGLSAFNLFFFGININPTINQDYYLQMSPTTKILKQTQGFFRFIIEKDAEFTTRFITGGSLLANLLKDQTVMTSNFGLYWRLFDANGYEAITINDQERFFYFLRNKGLDIVSPLVSMLNIRYIIAKGPIPSPRINLVKEIECGSNERVMVYENPSFLDRAFLVPSSVVIKDRRQILKRLLNPGFDPTKEVILEEEVKVAAQPQMLNGGVKIREYYPNQLLIETVTDKDSFLFLSETFYPGWKAYIDGEEVKIYRANYLFRAVWLESGRHRVEFIYQPLSFKVGIWASITVLGLLIIGVVTEAIAVDFHQYLS